jgi:hypothetical protein
MVDIYLHRWVLDDVHKLRILDVIATDRRDNRLRWGSLSNIGQIFSSRGSANDQRSIDLNIIYEQILRNWALDLDRTIAP